MDIKLALMTGVDIPIPECQLILHQPTIKEISMLGEKEFFIGIQCLSIDKNTFQNLIAEESWDELNKLSNFQILLEMLSQEKTKKIQVQNVLTILFPQYKIIILPRAFSFKQGDFLGTIDEKNFDSFQLLLKEVFCLNEFNKDNFNPQGIKAKEIAEKLMRARQRVAAQKKAEEGEGSLAQYVSSICVGIQSMSLQDVINLTLYQMYDLIERYSLYTSYDLDIKARLAGSTSDNKLENWMRPIH